MTRRELNPLLTHRIVRANGYWGKGKLISDAKAAYREVSGRKCPRECSVWAVTEKTTINELGRFEIPPPFAQPADITEDPG